MGQLFEDELDGYKFYNLYARYNGFGIRRSRSYTPKTTGIKTVQEFCCIRQVSTFMVPFNLFIRINIFYCVMYD